MRFLIILLLLALPAPARAWGGFGHQTVAEIAMLQARPATRAAVLEMLAREALLETPECPARTLAQAASWADCVRRAPDRFSYASTWHYQNVDVCRPFDAASACRDGNCVSAQVERQRRLLADAALPLRERVQALLFLLHFVGDLHQPLHVGDRGDRGGNEVPASYGLIPGRNLHSVWDGPLAERGITAPPAGAAALLAEVPAAERAAAAAGSADDWAREAWALSRDPAYAGALGGDPCGPVPAEGVRIDKADVRAAEPVVRRQIARAGLRLARLLDEALGNAADGRT